jgi:hypothetical protein
MTSAEARELLLRVVTQVAARQLQEGALLPFGATLGGQRNVSLLVPEGVKKYVTQPELEDYFVEHLRAAAAEQPCLTACFCADVRAHTERGELAPGLLVHIETSDGAAEDLVYPYRKSERAEIEFDPPARVAAEPRIFRCGG